MSVDELMKRLKVVRKLVSQAHDKAETVGHYDSVRILEHAHIEINEILFVLVDKGVVSALLPVDEGLFD